MTYEYECEKCQRIFEAEQKISEPPLTTCENQKCAGSVKRLIPLMTGFILKGGNWYRDGY